MKASFAAIALIATVTFLAQVQGQDSPSPSVTPSFNHTGDFTESSSISASASPTPSFNHTGNFTESPSMSISPSPSASFNHTGNFTESPSISSSNTPTASPSPSSSFNSTGNYTESSSISVSSSPTPSASFNHTGNYTESGSISVSPTISSSASPTPSASFNHTGNYTYSASMSISPTPSATFNHTGNYTYSSSMSISPTPSASFNHTGNFTESPTISLSPSNSLSGSKTPSPSPSVGSSPDAQPGTSDSAGKEAAVVVVSFILVTAGAALLVFASRRSGNSGYFGMHSSGLGYKSPVGAVLWVAALIAFSTGGSLINYEDYGIKPFATSYAKFLVAADVLAWLALSVLIAVDLTDRTVDPRATMVVEALLALFTFCAAVATTAHFNGKESYCKYDVASSTHCTTYQAGIFFTWLLFFGLCLKLCMSSAGRNAAGRGTL